MKILAETIIMAANIREESYTWMAYDKTIRESAFEACKVTGFDTDDIGVVVIMLVGDWNRSLEWAESRKV